MQYNFTLTDTQWKAKLSPEEYQVMRGKGTETAFCGLNWDNHSNGIYECKGCGCELFSSENKFDSGTGWPSFFNPVKSDVLEELPDYSYGMVRTEINCANCGCHLGHVFNDGPKPTGLRYCINSISLNFIAK